MSDIEELNLEELLDTLENQQTDIELQRKIIEKKDSEIQQLKELVEKLNNENRKENVNELKLQLEKLQKERETLQENLSQMIYTVAQFREQDKTNNRKISDLQIEIVDYKKSCCEEENKNHLLKNKVRNTLIGLYSGFLTIMVLITIIVISDEIEAIKNIPSEIIRYGKGIKKGAIWLWMRFNIFYDWLHTIKGWHQVPSIIICVVIVLAILAGIFFLTRMIIKKLKGWIIRNLRRHERNDAVRIKVIMMIAMAIGLFLLNLWMYSMWKVPVVATWVVGTVIIESLYWGMK